MGFQEVSSLDADVTVALGKVDKRTGKAYPKQAEGFYLGNRQVENRKGKSTLHFLQTAKGNLGVWGTTDLNRKLGQVRLGSMVRVTSTGTKSTPNGDMYTYKVEVDKENSIEVQAVESNEVSSSSSYQDADDDNGGDDDDDALANATSTMSAAERKARVDAMLKSKSAKN